MKFIETPLKGAYVLEPERIEDNRGFFARAWSLEEFRDFGLNTNIAQCNISMNWKKGTLRGMHYQARPNAEVKLVRCTSGVIFDVIVDIRPDSSTFKQWFGVELTAENLRRLYIPKDFAHGFQTLSDTSEVYYMMSEYFNPSAARGFLWSDPEIGIKWPMEPTVIAERDAGYPTFEQHSS